MIKSVANETASLICNAFPQAGREFAFTFSCAMRVKCYFKRLLCFGCAVRCEAILRLPRKSFA